MPSLAVAALLAVTAVPETPLPGPVRASEYRLALRLDPAAGTVEARAEVSFEEPPGPAAELRFYLHGELRVQSVEAGGEPLPFEEEPVFYRFNYSLVATRVTVTLEGKRPTGLTVVYDGVFNPSRARSRSDYMRIDADDVLLRGYGYSLWFPVFLEDAQDDQPAAFPEVTIRTPADFVPVLAGRRLAERVEGPERVSRWSIDVTPLFEVQLTARRFRTVQAGSGFFAYHLDGKGTEAAAREVLAVTERLATEFRRRYRASARSGQVHILQMPEFGDISSGNVVGLSTDVFLDVEADPASLLLLAHELVHPFVQVPVRRADPLYALVVEGFPSYFHLPVLAAMGRGDLATQRLAALEGRYVRGRETGRDRRGRLLPPEKPLVQIAPDELGVYKDVFLLADRAPLFLDYLRRRMGDEVFGEFVRELTNRDQLGLASFRALVLDALPGAEEELRLWLETTEYPDRFRLPAD